MIQLISLLYRHIHVTVCSSSKRQPGSGSHRADIYGGGTGRHVVKQGISSVIHNGHQKYIFLYRRQFRKNQQDYSAKREFPVKSY